MLNWETRSIVRTCKQALLGCQCFAKIAFGFMIYYRFIVIFLFLCEN